MSDRIDLQEKPETDIEAREAAAKVAQSLGVIAAESAEEVFADAAVDAVLIATATPTHADYIEMAIAAGKAQSCVGRHS